MSNIISLFRNRNKATLHVVPSLYDAQSGVAIMAAYSDSLRSMDKLELLEEMVKFQEERSMLGKLTDDMIARGIVLFVELEKKVETQELRSVIKSYLKHLKFEMEDRRQK